MIQLPRGYPIKGNASSGIYHVPSGSYYKRTKPERCFATESAARNAGYRKSKR
ncbi:sunset domain-containing protein [Nesterenkonia lutea]